MPLPRKHLPKLKKKPIGWKIGNCNILLGDDQLLRLMRQDNNEAKFGRVMWGKECIELKEWIMLVMSEDIDSDYCNSDDGQNLLHRAVLMGDELATVATSVFVDICELDRRDKAGYTPLDYAIERKDVKLIEILIKEYIARQECLDYRDRFGRTLLHLVVLLGDVGILKEALESFFADPNRAKIDINAQDKEGHTALHYALLMRERTDTPISTLLERAALCQGRRGSIGTSVNNAINTPTALLYQEMWKEKPSFKMIGELLGTRGINFHYRDGHQRTFLHAAAVLGHVKVVQNLISKGCNVNAEDDQGYSALDYSIEEDGKMVELLLNVEKIDITVRTNKGCTPYAIVEGLRNYFQTLPVPVKDREAFFDAADDEALTERMRLLHEKADELRLKLSPAFYDTRFEGENFVFPSFFQEGDGYNFSKLPKRESLAALRKRHLSPDSLRGGRSALRQLTDSELNVGHGRSNTSNEPCSSPISTRSRSTSTSSVLSRASFFSNVARAAHQGDPGAGDNHQLRYPKLDVDGAARSQDFVVVSSSSADTDTQYTGASSVGFSSMTASSQLSENRSTDDLGSDVTFPRENRSTDDLGSDATFPPTIQL